VLCFSFSFVYIYSTYVIFYFQEAFREFHPTTKRVSKYLPGLRIGKLASDEVVKDEDMKNDFIELRKTAEQMVCDHNPSAYKLIAHNKRYTNRLHFIYTIKSGDISETVSDKGVDTTDP